MNFHKPNSINKIDGVFAGITLAMRNRYNVSESIPGLNFGENTDVAESVIKDNLSVITEDIKHEGNIALAEQVHGADTILVSEPGYYQGVDGLITTEKDLLIGVKVADCAAIIMADSNKGVIGAVHAGWRGAAANILPKAIEMMIVQGAKKETLVCYIAPCISLNNFEIGEEVAEKFPPAFVNRKVGKKPHLDLKSFLKHQLLDKGVLESNIELDPRCTINEESFYSFRRERDKAGRMLAFIKQTKM